MVMNHETWIEPRVVPAPKQRCHGVDILAWVWGAGPHGRIEAARSLQRLAPECYIGALQHSRKRKAVGGRTYRLCALVNRCRGIICIIQQYSTTNASCAGALGKC